MKTLVIAVLILIFDHYQQSAHGETVSSEAPKQIPAFEGTDFKIDDKFDFIRALAKTYNSTERDRFGLEDLFQGIANSSNPPINVNVTDVLMAFNNLADATADKTGEFDISHVLDLAFPDPFPYLGEVEHLPPEFISGVMSLIKDILLGKKMDPGRITNFVLKIAGSTLDSAFKAMLGDVRYVANEAVENEHFVLEDVHPPSVFDEIKINFSNPTIPDNVFPEGFSFKKPTILHPNNEKQNPNDEQPINIVDANVKSFIIKPITETQQRQAVQSILKILKLVQGILSSVFSQLSAFLKAYMPQIASTVVETLNAVLPALVDPLVKSTPSILQLIGLLIATCPES